MQLCVRLLEIDARRNLALLQRQGDLDDGCHTARRFSVADVCFDRADSEGLIGCPRVFEDGSNGCHLDGIPRRRPCSMRLEVCRLRRIKPSSPVAVADQSLLCLAARGGDGFGLAVLVDARLVDDGADGVSVPQRVVQPLQDDGS
jgi:hypothetical protein